MFFYLPNFLYLSNNHVIFRSSSRVVCMRSHLACLLTAIEGLFYAINQKAAPKMATLDLARKALNFVFIFYSFSY